MQVTVTIPDELLAQVKARGITPESFVSELIEDAARAKSEVQLAPVRDMEAFFKEMTAYSDKIPELPSEAFTRESIYQDHD